ncbi:MAG TPA: diacylglycerol kinase family protein [Gaiellaceae bacterium]|nr:diacylglycerol kinase family protein [Gaiellaceae bacterium]
MAEPVRHSTAADRSRRNYLIVNPRSGDDSPSPDELVAAAGERGIDCHVLGDGDDAGELARAVTAHALGVAGGDGSLAAVANVALERDLPFVCIPFGTRNHFARDLGLDRDDPLAALAAFDGIERRVDVGRVNGRLFLNNLSLGVYSDLVYRREHHRRRGELFAGLRALKRLTREHHRLRLRVDGGLLQTRVLLVANNGYELNLFSIGERSSLTEGRLHLYTTRGWLPTTWTERDATRFVVSLEERDVIGATDGEPIELQPPLEIECLPGALRILMPRGDDNACS